MEQKTHARQPGFVERRVRDAFYAAFLCPARLTFALCALVMGLVILCGFFDVSGSEPWLEATPETVERYHYVMRALSIITISVACFELVAIKGKVNAQLQREKP
jgi:hypothetical protein